MAKKKESLTAGEKRRLRQLVICLVLFGVVFVGRGVDLGPVSQLSRSVGELVRRDTDVQEVFVRVGESFAEGEAFQAVWSGLFAPAEGTDPGGEDGQST